MSGAARKIRRQGAVARMLSPTGGRLNAYRCERGGGFTITVQLCHGTTPSAITCRAECCDRQDTRGMAYSLGNPSPWPPGVPTRARWEWYAPTAKSLEGLRRAGGDAWEHVRRGGLLIRRRHKAA